MATSRFHHDKKASLALKKRCGLHLPVAL